MTLPWRELDLREFGDWPLSWRVIACMLLALLAFGLPWALLTYPISIERQALMMAESELKIRLQQARGKADAFPPLPREEVKTEPYPPPNLPALITTIAEAAQVAGLRDGQFRSQPGMTSDGPDNAEVSPRIELRLHGTWKQLGHFATDLAEPILDAVLSLHDIHLRASPRSTLLELTATASVHPRPAIPPTPVFEPYRYEFPDRNPFADASTRSPSASLQRVGSIGTGDQQVGLVLGADGQLYRASAVQPSNQD